jgi:hypothetical protein
MPSNSFVSLARFGGARLNQSPKHSFGEDKESFSSDRMISPSPKHKLTTVQSVKSNLN